ncbi:MAG: Rpn family recombination-promoting nuclease/putative transposase [Treponema sp.]|nr:Rpn family recombination-promoting nuclease/putative transposase [Treponema sp.]
MAKVEELLKKEPSKLSDGEKWALFFRYVGDIERRGLVNELLRGDEGIAMAGEALFTLSRDEAERARLESDLKYELDLQSSMTDARREGRAEGLIAGKAEGLAEAARTMKQDGLSPEKIREYTHLSPEEIERL